jgi:hypothetical protein
MGTNRKVGAMADRGIFFLRTRNDLSKFARESKVPSHAKRKNYQRERWTLAQYLVALFHADMLRLPIRVIHQGYRTNGAAPDFKLGLSDGTTLGIEVTSATTSKLQDYYAKNERGELDPKRELKIAPGDAGDSPETYWAALVLFFVNRKTRALSKGHFLRADRQELLIYADTGAAGPEMRPAVERLRSEMRGADRPAEANFATISIVTTYRTLIYDLAGDWRVIPIPFVL